MDYQEFKSRPSGANGRQVGGDHYNSRTQPWDFITDNKLNFLSGSIVSYLTRWERKGNMQDLQKAEHYLEKLLELVGAGKLQPACMPLPITNFSRPLPHPVSTGLRPVVREDYEIAKEVMSEKDAYVEARRAEVARVVADNIAASKVVY